MRTAILLAIAAVTFGCADCSDPGDGDADPWTVGEDSPDSGAPTVDLGLPPQTEDVGGPPPPIDLPTCVEADTYVFNAYGAEFVVSPVVVGDRVFAAGRVDRDAAGSTLLEWSEDGLDQLVDDPLDDGIIAFSDDYVWIASAEGLVRRLNLRDGDLETLVEVNIPYRTVAWSYEYAPIRKSAAGGRFGYLEQGNIRIVDDLAIDLLNTDASSSPWVTDRVVAYQFNDVAGMSIRVHQGSDFFEFGQEESNSAWPVATDQAVFFVHDAEVRTVGLGGSNNFTVLEDRFCGPLHANRTTAVTACATRTDIPQDGFRHVDYLSLNATEVWSFDGATGEATLVATATGPIYAPIVTDNWIAWAEYDSDLGGGPPVVGEIMVLPRGADEATPIATIGNGCPFCGAYWPPPRLVLGDNTLAWNYALEERDDEEMFGPRGQYGVARLRPCD